MARPLRIQYPGAYYHVMNRGNHGEAIFITNTDRSRFVEALADSCETFGVILIAYVLMTNHFHLLVQTAHDNLSEFAPRAGSGAGGKGGSNHCWWMKMNIFYR